MLKVIAQLDKYHSLSLPRARGRPAPPPLALARPPLALAAPDATAIGTENDA